MNNERIQEIVDEYVARFIGLGYYIMEASFDCPARVDNDLKVLSYNNEKVTIFVMCHEFNHAKLEHGGRISSFNGNDERNPNEDECNERTIEELLKRYMSLDIEFNYYQFMDWYGVPPEQEARVKRIFAEQYAGYAQAGDDYVYI